MKKQIYILLFLNLLVMSLMNFAHPVTPALLEFRGSSSATNGILMALMQLAQVLFSPFWIKIYQKHYIKKYLIIGVVFYGLSQLILGFGTTDQFMFLGRILAGFFSCAWLVGSMIYLVNIVENKDRTKYLGYFMVTSYLGNILGQSSMGEIGLLSIFIPFVLQAITGILIGIIIYFILDDHKFKTKSEEKNKKDIKNILNFLILVLLFAFISSLYSTSIGYYLKNVMNVQSDAIGYLSSYVSFILILINLFLLTKFEKNFGIIDSIKISAIFGIIGFIAYLIFDFGIFKNLFLVLFSITLIHIPIALYRPFIQRTLLKTTQEKANNSVGYINSFNALGAVAGALISGYTFDILPEIPFYLIGITFVIITIFIHFKIVKDVK